MPINRKGGGVAPGNIDYFAANTPPAGWIKANGAAISRSTYAALFAVVGTTYGAGDGSTTFNVPDLRGEFVRGWSDGRAGVDAGRAMGSAQGEAFASHTHGANVNFSGSGTSANGSITSGAVTSSTQLTTSAAGGTETRPRNVAMLACIKY